MRRNQTQSGSANQPGNGRSHHRGSMHQSHRRQQSFLEEWHSTLQHLRDIGTTVSQPRNQPIWISSSAPVGAQADQFLHAHYYQRTFEGRKAKYAEFFEQNKNRRDEAVAEALDWWRQLPVAPSSEEIMLNVTAPFLRLELTEERLAAMTYGKFQEICLSVHAINPDFSPKNSVESDYLLQTNSYKIFGKRQKYRVFFRSGPFFVRRRGGLHGFGEPLQGAPCRRPVFPVLQHIDDRLVG